MCVCLGEDGRSVYSRTFDHAMRPYPERADHAFERPLSVWHPVQCVWLFIHCRPHFMSSHNRHCTALYGGQPTTCGKPHTVKGRQQIVNGKQYSVCGRQHNVYGKQYSAYGRQHSMYGKKYSVYGRPHSVYGRQSPVYGRPHTLLHTSPVSNL